MGCDAEARGCASIQGAPALDISWYQMMGCARRLSVESPLMPKETSQGKRTALLVRCTVEEAELIRQAAQAERRTISGYILNSVLHRIAVQEKTHKQFEDRFGSSARNLPVKKGKAQSSEA